MARFKTAFVILSILSLGISGCAHEKKLYPVHDRVLTYDLPPDLTYLRTLEALEKVPDWELEQTEKEKGLIRVRNTNFSRFDDADERLATFLIKPIERNRTSVSLVPESRRVVEGDKLLEQIEQSLNREMGRRQGH